jgi:hypothetical protein
LPWESSCFCGDFDGFAAIAVGFEAKTDDFNVKSVAIDAGATAITAIAVEIAAIADAIGAEAEALAVIAAGFAAIANESAARAVAFMTEVGASKPDEIARAMETVLSEPEKGLVRLRRCAVAPHILRLSRSSYHAACAKIPEAKF